MSARPSKNAIEKAYDRGYRAGQNVMVEIERAARPEPRTKPVTFVCLSLEKKLQMVALTIASDTASIRFAARYLEDARSALADSMAVLDMLLSEVECVAVNPFGTRDSDAALRGRPLAAEAEGQQRGPQGIAHD